MPTRPPPAISPLAIGAALALCLVAMPADAQQPSPRRGHAITVAECGPCHAVDHHDHSRNLRAPALRDLSRRHPGEAVVDIVLKSWATPHREMPDFFFDTAKSREILAYLESLQTR